ncbi:hypothetical protein QFZ76_009426 [Streptomyces sp. V4I2]|nr:hypothetical protein [Streptomyces sp. V4I2]
MTRARRTRRDARQVPPAGPVAAGSSASAAGRTTHTRDFRANEEVEAIHWWNFREALPGPIQPLDAYLAGLTRELSPGLSHCPGQG